MSNSKLSVTLAITNRTVIWPISTPALSIKLAGAPHRHGAYSFYAPPASTKSRVNIQKLIFCTLYSTAIIHTSLFFTRELIVVHTIEPLCTIFSHEQLFPTATLSQGVVGKGAATFRFSRGYIFWCGGGRVFCWWVSRVFLATNMESTRTPPIILCTVPVMSDKVDIHDHVFLWTRYVLVVKPFLSCTITVFCSLTIT